MEAERQNTKLAGDLKSLNLQKVSLEEQLKIAVSAKDKVDGDLKIAEKNLEALKQKKDKEVGILQGRVKELESEIRADRAEGRIPMLEKEHDDNAEDAKAAVATTEGVLRAQLAILLPGFDSSQIEFLKEIIDGKVVDIPMDPPPS
ncbi:hypothetical protein PIB30_031546 [Stylosanthes scabra]|uniref:Uncharacterized protein n=1 Tax=Stylosanthes scabra TaxID=79078 RepID=A0ABU6QC39_9FABA|nr:hypothetical protein [Stylosanthes scabra]